MWACVEQIGSEERKTEARKALEELGGNIDPLSDGECAILRDACRECGAKARQATVDHVSKRLMGAKLEECKLDGMNLKSVQLPGAVLGRAYPAGTIG